MSWADLQSQSASTAVGQALNQEAELRKSGAGSPARENTLRTFGAKQKPAVTLYR